MKQLKYQLQTSAPAKPPSFLLPLLQNKAVAATWLGTRINLEVPPAAKRTGAAPVAAPAGRASAPRHLVGSPLPGRRGCFMKEKPLGCPAGPSVLVTDQPGCSRGRAHQAKPQFPPAQQTRAAPAAAVPAAQPGGLGKGWGQVLAWPALPWGPLPVSPGHGVSGGGCGGSDHPRSGSPLCRERAPGPRCCALSLIRGTVRRSIIRC